MRAARTQAARSQDKVAALALLAAVGLGGFLALRAHGLLGASYTDGLRRYDARTGAGVRHAVWERAETLEALGEAADPSLSPEGDVLVFASGARGLNAELHLAELVDGVPVRVRPLVELNSVSDDLAPAFGPDGLYFASDRPGGPGGLDLFRAPFVDGTFGPPERLGPGLNSAADETDPAPVPGSATLVFASNRLRADFDLFASTPDEEGFHHPLPLAALNSPGEEREPAFPRDGRSLLFASRRAGSAGFDLYRALTFDGAWQAPRPIQALNSADDERGPWPTADGFTLWFVRTGAAEPGLEETEAASRVLRARSRELFRLPPPPVTLAQWLTLAGLVLVALLAWLSKRWTALDVLWRCLLASLLLHLFLALYLRTLAPEARRYEVNGAEEPAFRVRLAPHDAADEGRGLTGPLAPPRERFTAALAQALSPAAAPERAPLAPPAAAPEAPPERARALAADPAPLPTTALAQPQEEAPHAAVPAPELPLAARAGPAPARARVDAPQRLQEAGEPSDGLAVATPGASTLAAPEVSAQALAQGPEREPGLARPREAPPAPVLATPRESGATSSAPAPPLALDATAPAPRAADREAGPTRLALAAPSATEHASTSLEPPSMRLASGPTDPGEAPAREPLAARPAREGAAAEAGWATPELRAPAPLSASAPVPATSGPVASSPVASGPVASSPGFDALTGLAGAAGGTSTPWRPTTEAPQRLALAAPSAQGAPQMRPEPRAPALALPAESERARDERAPPRLAESPYQNRFGELKLRALEEFGGTAESEHAVAAGLAYLARIQGEDGAWGERTDAHAKYLDVRIGKSALALLAFLGAGHVPAGPGEHAAVVERALLFLLASQDEASGHFGRSCSYGHGIATYALAECFALTQDERLRAPLERALEEILRHQSRVRDPRFLGGWGYYFADGRVWNGDEWPRTSVTAWQVMALESARLGGLAVPDEAFQGARAFLVNAWDPRARAFRYDHDPARLASGYPILPASTPAALFALSLLGVDARADELAEARRFVLARMPDGYRHTGDDDFVRRARGNPYFWYYASLALFRVGGSAWERWNEALQATLLPAQEPDGSWRPLDTYAEYAGDEDDERAYTTALCVLSLEVYYRYFTPLLQVR